MRLFPAILESESLGVVIKCIHIHLVQMMFAFLLILAIALTLRLHRISGLAVSLLICSRANLDRPKPPAQNFDERRSCSISTAFEGPYLGLMFDGRGGQVRQPCSLQPAFSTTTVALCRPVYELKGT